MRKRHKFALFFSCFLLLATIFIGVYIEHQDYINNVSIAFQSGNTQETIELFCNNGIYYAFLPSNANIEEINLNIPSGCKAKINDVLVSDKSNDFKYKTNTEYSLQLINYFGIEVALETVVILQAKNIPSLSISLLDGTLNEIHSDKNISKTGILQTTLSDNTVDFRGSFNSFHGRGNSSWGQEKKSYTIEFDNATSLLGMDKGTKWLLISNSFDESSLRNKLVYDTAKEFGANFAIDSAYVDLYIDNQYMGLYLLCEKIEVSENSVNITDLHTKTQQVNLNKLSSHQQFQENNDEFKRKGFLISNNPMDITGGYLIQIDYHADTIETEESFVETKNTPFIVSSPKNASKEQIVYISNYIDDIEKSIISGDLSKIDIESFVTQIILFEYFANADNCSVFLYKEIDGYSNKLFCGPLWDYDLSMGHSWSSPNVDPYVLYAKKVDLFELLYANKDFGYFLKKTYEEKFSNQIKNYVTEKLSLYEQLIECSFTMDKIRWEYVEATEDKVNDSQKRFDTLKEHASQIEIFLTQRQIFLNDVWLNDTVYCAVIFSDGADFKKTYHIKQGELFNEPYPLYHSNNGTVTFKGWFDENGIEYEQGTQITGNRFYLANFSENNHMVSDNEKTSTIDLLKEKFNELIKIEIELWCFGAILLFVVITILKDLPLTQRIRRRKNGKRT